MLGERIGAHAMGRRGDLLRRRRDHRRAGRAAHLAALSFNKGDLMALASMMMWAAYTVLLRLRRDPLDDAELIVMVCAFGLVFMVPWLAIEARRRRASTRPRAPRSLFGIGSLLLAYAGWSYVVTRLGAARAGVTMHLMPALGVVLAAIFPRRISALVSLRRHRADPRRRGALVVQSFIGFQ